VLNYFNHSSVTAHCRDCFVILCILFDSLYSCLVVFVAKAVPNPYMIIKTRNTKFSNFQLPIHAVS